MKERLCSLTKYYYNDYYYQYFCYLFYKLNQMPVLFLFCRSAQFEHTILITKTGFEVLTAGKNENFDKKELHIAGSDDIVKETSSSSESTWTFK